MFDQKFTSECTLFHKTVHDLPAPPPVRQAENLSAAAKFAAQICASAASHGGNTGIAAAGV